MNQFEIEAPAVHCTTERSDDCVRKITIDISAKELKRFQKRCKKKDIASDDHIMHVLMHTLCTKTVPADHPNIFNQPRVCGPKPQFTADTDMTLSLEIDVWPDLDVPDLSSLEILMPSSEITDAEIDAELLEQRRLIGIRSPQAGAMSAGDSVTLAITLQCDGDPGCIAEGETHQLTLTDQPMRVMVQGVQVEINAAELLGHHADATIEYTFKVPKSSPRIDLVEETVHARISVEQVEQVEPASVEAVLAEYEAPSEANFRMQIRLALQQVKLEQQKALARAQAIATAAALIPFNLPKSLIEKTLLKLVQSLQKVLQERGYQTEESQRAALNKIRTKVEAHAARKVRAQLFAAAVREACDVMMDQDLLMDEISRIAQAQGRRPADVREELIENQGLNAIKAQVAVNIVADWIISQGTTRTVPMDIFEAEAKDIPV